MWIRFALNEDCSWSVRAGSLINYSGQERRCYGLRNIVKAQWTRRLRRDVDQVLHYAIVLVAARVTWLILPMLTSSATTDYSLLITGHSYSRVTALSEEKRCSSYIADKH